MLNTWSDINVCVPADESKQWCIPLYSGFAQLPQRPWLCFSFRFSPFLNSVYSPTGVPAASLQQGNDCILSGR